MEINKVQIQGSRKINTPTKIMMTIPLKFLSWKSFPVLAALALPGTAFAGLTVNGTPNGQWNSMGTMTYDSTATDPTSQSNGQFILNGGGSLTESSGTLTLTNTDFGVFVGQSSTAGTINMSGGTFIWNANGGSEQRFVFGNSNATGLLTMTGGTFSANTGAGTDSSRGLIFGRQGGTGTANLSGTATFISATDRFGMGGEFGTGAFTFNTNTTGTITLGTGAPQFILNGLLDTTAANFGINIGSYFNFMMGSGGALKFASGNGTAAGDTAIPKSFFDGLVTSGDILINGATASPGQFSYSVDTVNNLGVYTLAVPEPSTWVVLGAGLSVLAGWRFSCRRAIAAV